MYNHHSDGTMSNPDFGWRPFFPGQNPMFFKLLQAPRARAAHVQSLDLHVFLLTGEQMSEFRVDNDDNNNNNNKKKGGVSSIGESPKPSP